MHAPDVVSHAPLPSMPSTFQKHPDIVLQAVLEEMSSHTDEHVPPLEAAGVHLQFNALQASDVVFEEQSVSSLLQKQGAVHAAPPQLSQTLASGMHCSMHCDWASDHPHPVLSMATPHSQLHVRVVALALDVVVGAVIACKTGPAVHVQSLQFAFVGAGHVFSCGVTCAQHALHRFSELAASRVLLHDVASPHPTQAVCV